MIRQSSYILYSLMLLLLTACVGGGSGQEEETQVSSSDSLPNSFANDDELLDFVQRASLNYMWEGAEPTSGLAPERIHPDGDYPEDDADVVTTGGSGFGIAGLIVAAERGFIPRDQVVERLHAIMDYLTAADRFHGVWPHWLYGPTGKVKPFSTKDDGGDLVESSFLMTGILCVRQYFKEGNERERELAEKCDKLWKEMEFSWYQNGKDALYWHWSPDYDWEMNFPLEGYNECLIAYILGASSPTYPITPEAYHKCWARSGKIKSEAAPYGHPLRLSHNGSEELGGPLFWAHYSYFGLDPRHLSDQYADYFDVVRNHALAQYDYCVANPKRFKGYSKDCWGLTASYSVDGYSAHRPGDGDLGVISPTAALSSFPYTPEESMSALKYFYSKKGALWGKYGFYDAFSEEKGWVARKYLAIDQCMIAPMIENHRSGLLWKLFMSCPEIQAGLTKLGFTFEVQPS